MSSLLGLVEYFRISKALVILLYILYELWSKSKWEVQEETLADFNSDVVKTTLRLRYFKMTLPLFQVLQKSLPIPQSLCDIQ